MKERKNLKGDLPVIGALGLGALIGALNIPLFNVAIPKMMEIFGASVTTVQWLSSGYLLALGIITPVAAYLGNRFGNKRVFILCELACLLLAIVGSFSQSIEMVIVVRFMFGLAAGLLLPLSMAMVYQLVSPANHTTAISIWGMINMMGGILPACISGVMISYFPWYSLLLFNVPFAIVGLLSGWRFLPKDQPGSAEPFRIVDFLQLGLGSMLLLMAFSKIAEWGIISSNFLAVFVAGILLLGSYFVLNRKNEKAMLNLSVFRFPAYTAAFVIDTVMIVSMYITTFAMPLFLQNSMQLSPLVTGFVVLPGSICMILSMPIGGALYEKKGGKALAILGLTVIVLSGLPFLLVSSETTVFFILILMMFRSIGIGFMNLMTTNATMSAVPTDLTSHASAMTNWVRNMCGALTTSISSGLVGLFLRFGNTIEALSYAQSVHVLMTIAVVMALLCIPLVRKHIA